MPLLAYSRKHTSYESVIRRDFIVNENEIFHLPRLTFPRLQVGSDIPGRVDPHSTLPSLSIVGHNSLLNQD